MANHKIDLHDDSEFLEKEISRQAGKLAYKKQLEEFEKDSQSGTFKLITQIVETLGSLAFVAFVVYELFQMFKESKAGKILVVLVVLMVIGAFVFKYIAKYYYIKGDLKKFRVFNTASKISEVSLSVADAVSPSGNKMVSRVEKTTAALSDAVGKSTKLSKMDDDGGIYKSSEYNKYREECYLRGLPISSTRSKIGGLIRDVETKVSSKTNIPEDVQRDIMISLYMARDYKNGMCRDIINERFFTQLLGGLLFFYKGISGISMIPNFIPGLGYTDDMFMLNCVLAENLDTIKKYRGWRYVYKKNKKEFTREDVLTELRKLAVDTLDDGGFGLVNRILEEDENKTELLKKCQEILKKEKDSTFYIVFGYVCYEYIKADLIHDDIPYMGKCDDMYVASVIEDTLNKQETLGEDKEPSVVNALDNLLSATGGL